MAKAILNPAARQSTSRGLFSPSEYAEVRAFYDSRPALTATPLTELPRLAASLGVRSVLVKDESARFGLNAFKVVGVRFAVERMAARGTLRTLTCATAGNHGRAVARVARDLGLESRIYVPSYTERAHIDAIAGEGARVAVFDGSYDETVRACAADADREGWTLVSDTGWPGYEEVPRWIMLGYTRLMDECATLRPASFSAPAIVVVQAGVGGLAAAVLSWLTSRYGALRPFTIVAEPESAACVMSSIEAGRPHPLAGTPDTIMAGLRCAEVSTAAWPALHLADACVVVDDDAARRAVKTLAEPAGGDPAISAGPSGACGLAALRAIAESPALVRVRDAARFGPACQVILINSECGFR